jgi:hypothetical protein
MTEQSPSAKVDLAVQTLIGGRSVVLSGAGSSRAAKAVIEEYRAQTTLPYELKKGGKTITIPHPAASFRHLDAYKLYALDVFGEEFRQHLAEAASARLFALTNLGLPPETSRMNRIREAILARLDLMEDYMDGEFPFSLLIGVDGPHSLLGTRYGMDLVRKIGLKGVGIETP